LPGPDAAPIFGGPVMPYLILFTMILLLGLLVACAIT
jgi:hypothetical protein